MTAPALRILTPAPGVLAFYAGRGDERFMAGENWVDDGAISLGIASYAVHDGDQALIYDTHVSVPFARAIRAHLEGMGVTRFTVVLSHWHLDHVAGTEAFADGPVIANTRTTAHLTARKAAIEDASDHGPPAIAPLILPNRSFDGTLRLQIGRTHVELIQAEVHSDDATVLWLPDQRLLLAGDTVEDSLTYVSEPARLAAHRADLARLAALQPRRILPNHGDPGVIAAGGYGPGLIAATDAYVAHLLACQTDPAARARTAEAILAPWIATGDVVWFPPYAAIHAQNLTRVLAVQPRI